MDKFDSLERLNLQQIFEKSHVQKDPAEGDEKKPKIADDTKADDAENVAA